MEAPKWVILTQFGRLAAVALPVIYMDHNHQYKKPGNLYFLVHDHFLVYYRRGIQDHNL